MKYQFETTADQEAALAALGREFESTVTHHLNVLVSNYLDRCLMETKTKLRALPLADAVKLVEEHEAALDVAISAKAKP